MIVLDSFHNVPLNALLSSGLLNNVGHWCWQVDKKFHLSMFLCGLIVRRLSHRFNRLSTTNRSGQQSQQEWMNEPTIVDYPTNRSRH